MKAIKLIGCTILGVFLLAAILLQAWFGSASFDALAEMMRH